MTEVIWTLRKARRGVPVGLNDLALLNPDYLDVVGRSTSLQTRILIEMVQRFNRLYAERKGNSTAWISPTWSDTRCAC
jgi:hypothetical protein